jgi:hypothetical protein
VHPLEVQDAVTGGDIEISVARPRMTPVDFEIWAPSDTSIAVRTTMGRVNISGLAGHITVNSVDGDLHLAGVRSPSVDARVIRGDIYFDGELAGDGPYSFQSMHGDIDVMLPDSGSFDLVAKSLYDNINLGGFLLSQLNQKNQFISGKHDRGGPKLNLTAFEGHIMLHKK